MPPGRATSSPSIAEGRSNFIGDYDWFCDAHQAYHGVSAGRRFARRDAAASRARRDLVVRAGAPLAATGVTSEGRPETRPRTRSEPEAHVKNWSAFLDTQARRWLMRSIWNRLTGNDHRFRVWLVDDSEENRTDFYDGQKHHFDVETFSTPAELLDALKTGAPDALLCDI